MLTKVFPITLEQCDPKLNCGGRTFRRDKATWGFENYPPPLPHGERGIQGPSPVKFVKFKDANGEF